MAQDVKPMDYSGPTIPAPIPGPGPGPSQPSDTLSDSVSSLRALALSTLRPKRRKEVNKAVSNAAVAPRIRPDVPIDNSVLLDYGSETKEDPQSVKSAARGSDSLSPRMEASPLQNGEDMDTKEEGEISDEDTRSSVSSIKPTIKDPFDAAKMQSSAYVPGSNSMVSTISDAQKSLSSVYNELSAQQTIAPANGGHWNNWVPSQDHVRPGLKMNMDQFNLVKELILDLLGWGVSPEYLVDCGLSREAVFYTFTELNLRLPKNLDVSGLLPSFPHDQVVGDIARSSTQPQIPEAGTLSLDTSHQSELDTLDTRQPSLSHPLPTKPHLSAEAPSVVTASPAITTSQSSASNQSLSVMEAQRRQELQARKALLASRRKKAHIIPSADTTSFPTSTVTRPSILKGSVVDEPMPITPTEIVDDFLKSMLETSASSSSAASAPTHRAGTLSGGVSLGVSSSAGVSSTESTKEPSSIASIAMDVDSIEDPIPGITSLRSRSTPRHDLPIISTLSTTSALANGQEDTVALAVGSSPNITLQTPNRSSSGSTPPSEAYQVRPSPSPASSAMNGRRGTKRPVAMDFVDVEHSSSGPSGTDASMPALPPFVRRKLGSFAGLGGHLSRRCVIDLSDSEDEESPEPLKEFLFGPDERPISTISQDNTRNISAPTPPSRPPTTRPSRSNVVVPPKPGTPVLTPESLVEKEQQIKRMKELIARREQERLKKLVEKSRTPAGTPPPSTSASMKLDLASPTASIPVKAEESDSAGMPVSSVSEVASHLLRSRSSSVHDSLLEESRGLQNLNGSGSASDSALPTPAGSDFRFSRVLRRAD